MSLQFHLKIVGVLMLLLAMAHLFFPKRFGWKEDLAKLTLLNRQIFLVHCFFICLFLALSGLLCLVWTDALLEPGKLAKLVLGGFIIFWAARLFSQWFVYDTQLWRGNSFNTVAHIFFTLMWIYYVAVFIAAFRHQSV